MNSNVRAYAIIPESPLFFGSGRDFSPTSSTWDEGMLLPTPSTLFGALASSLFMRFEGDVLERRKRILKEMPKLIPVILEVDSKELAGEALSGDIYLPAPPLIGRDEFLLPVLKDDKYVTFLEPTVEGKWLPIDKLISLLRGIKRINGRFRAEIEEEPWNSTRLINDLIDPELVLAPSYSVGIKIDPIAGVTETGMLYRIRTVSPKVELGGRSFLLGFLAVGGGETWRPPRWVFLGGERRVAKIVEFESQIRRLEEWISQSTADSEIPFTLLITPGIYLVQRDDEGKKSPKNHTGLFTALYTREPCAINLSSLKTFTPKGVIINMNLPMSFRCGYKESIKVIFRATSHGSLLWIHGGSPISFAHELGFGIMLRVGR